MKLTICQLQLRLKISQASIHHPLRLLGVVLGDNLAHYDRSGINTRHRKTIPSALNSQHSCCSYYSNTTKCLLYKSTTEFCFYIKGTHTEIHCAPLFLVAFNQVTKRDYLTSSPSVRLYQRGSDWTDLPEIWYWELLRKSTEKLLMWLKSDQNMGHFTRRPKSVYIADSSTKYSPAREQCRVKSLLRFHGNNEHIFYCWQLHVGQQYKGTYCCVSMEQMLSERGAMSR